MATSCSIGQTTTFDKTAFKFRLYPVDDNECHLPGIVTLSFIIELQKLIQEGRDLPTLPDVVLELRSALDDENIGERTVADIVGRDPVITGKLLRVANSVAYSGGFDVTTVNDAVRRVGLREVRGICVVLSVVDAFAGSKGGLDLNEFWDHSAAVGRVAKILCRHVNLGNATGPEDIYVAALLHDVGLLVLDQFFPDRLAENLHNRSQSNAPLWKVEQDSMGINHGGVGALIIEQWALPDSIRRCVANHHTPELTEQDFKPGSQLVRAAEALCTHYGAGVNVEGPADDEPYDALLELGLTDRAIESVLSEIEEAGVSMGGVLTA